MSTTRIRLSGLFFSLLALVGIVGAITFTWLRTDAAEANDSKLNQLLNEKLTILQQVASQMDELHKLHEIGDAEVYEAHVAVHRARLELCATDKEKIAVLEEILDGARKREARLLNLPKTTAISLKLEAAQVNRLDIEIELERIKSK